MGDSMRPSDVLKLVHPGRHVERFRQPIKAGEIMDKYPRHCITRPDFFEFPFIVVHPESVLFPGEKFYLVPYRTVYNRMKALTQQQQQPSSTDICKKHQKSSKPCHCNSLGSYMEQGSPSKAPAGATPKRKQKDKNKSRQSNDAAMDRESYGGQHEQDSEAAKNFYKLSFYKTWNNMRRNLHQPQEGCSFLDSGLDSPFESGCFSLMWAEQSRLASCSVQEEMLDVKSCLRKEDSARKKLKLKVRFMSPSRLGRLQKHEKADLDYQVPWHTRQHDWL